MDPRKKNYNPDYHAGNKLPKRGASRSPEGAAARKFSKPNSRNESSASTINDSPRPSSVSSAPVRPGGVGIPPMENRRPSNQLPNELRKGGSNGFVGSPESLGSKYEDAQSGRSTPSSINGVVARQNIPPVPQMNGTADGIANSTSVAGLFMGFSNQVTQIATSQILKQQVDARLKQATEEYDGMAGHFANFPAIKESKSMKKQIAEREVKNVEDRLNEQMRVQKASIEGIAALISQAAEVKPTSRAIERSDPVPPPRANPSRLEAQDDSFQQELIFMRSTASKMSCMSGMVPDLQKQIGKLNVHLNNELDDVKRILAAQNPQRTSLLEKQKLEEQKREQGLKESAELVTTVTEMKTKLDLLSSFGNGEDHQPLGNPLDGIKGFGQKVVGLQQQLTEVVQGLSDVRGEVHEEGKEPVNKRLKNLDLVVNNLATKVESHDKPPLQLRLSQLEQDFNTLEADLKAVKDSEKASLIASTATSSTLPDPESFITRLKQVETLVQSFEAQSVASSNAILDAIDARVSELQAQITSVDDARSGDATRINTAFADVTNNVNDVKKGLAEIEESRIEFTVIKESVAKNGASLTEMNKLLDERAEGNRADMDLLKGRLSTVEQQLKGSASSRTPTPRPAQSATPRLPNGIAHSPMVNEMPPPAMGSPGSNAVPTNPVALISKLHQDVQFIIDKHDALTAVTQRLQMQYNNLTTDEICQAMLDQFAVVWPHAKNYENSIRGLMADFSTLQRDVHELRGDTNKNVETASNVATAAAKTADEAKRNSEEAKKAADAASTSAAAADNVVLGVRNDIREISWKVDSAESAARDAGNAASAARREVGDVKQTMGELERTISEMKQKPDQDMPDANGPAVNGVPGITPEQVEAFKDEVAAISQKTDQHATKLEKLSERVGVHDTTLTSGEPAVAKLNTEMEALKKRLGQIEKRLELLIREWST